MEPSIHGKGGPTPPAAPSQEQQPSTKESEGRTIHIEDVDFEYTEQVVPEKSVKGSRFGITEAGQKLRAGFAAVAAFAKKSVPSAKKKAAPPSPEEQVRRLSEHGNRLSPEEQVRRLSEHGNRLEMRSNEFRGFIQRSKTGNFRVWNSPETPGRFCLLVVTNERQNLRKTFFFDATKYGFVRLEQEQSGKLGGKEYYTDLDALLEDIASQANVKLIRDNPEQKTIDSYTKSANISDMNGNQAVEYLRNRELGDYVLRKSQTPGRFSISIVTEKGPAEAAHFNFIITPQGFAHVYEDRQDVRHRDKSHKNIKSLIAEILEKMEISNLSPHRV